MAKYRKRPVVIDAVQFQPGQALPDGVHLGCTECGNTLAFVPHIHTLEGTMTVAPGDWVITGVKGERYPCKPDIFDKTYEPA
jgi:hypothetical protein